MECVLCCTARDSEWMKQARGNIWEAWAPCDEFGPCKLYAWKGHLGALNPYGPTCRPLSHSRQVSNWRWCHASTPAGPSIWRSSSNKVQRMHRYDRNCLCVWKIARNLKLANRLKLLWPVSNCKHLGLRSCCTVFGPSPAVRSFYLNIFHLHGQGGSGRLWIRNGYNVVVYDRSMKMDGPCALDRCNDGWNWKCRVFFLDFFECIIFWYL